MKAIGTTVKRAIGLVRSVVSARQEAEQARRELEQTRLELEEARLRLRRAERQKERLAEGRRLKNQQLKQTARDYLLCKMPKGSVCAEIGVHEGAFSAHILDAIEPERLHLIDPWTQGEGLFGDQAAEQASVDQRLAKVEERFAEELAAGRVRIHRALSSEIIGEFGDTYFDWIYVDGNHLYEFVKQDLELYYPKVKVGGYMAGDDYGTRGTWDNGVQKAVDEFVAETAGLVLEVKGSQFIIEKRGSG